MREEINKIFGKIVAVGVQLVSFSKIGRYFLGLLHLRMMDNTIDISHNGVNLRFVAPNNLCFWRIKTFSTKEPETLEWIDEFPEGSVIWDIGANVGLYAIYAAKRRNCRVWAFEPSIFNLELLARNIFINDLVEQISLVPFALSESSGFSLMHMTTTEMGGALSTFDKHFGWDGNLINEVFKFQTLGVSMDEMVMKFSIPFPDYIKMDVDGLEHFILMGGGNVLSNIKGILIEINDNFPKQSSQCENLLIKAGLILRKKSHSTLVNFSKMGFSSCYNQIWYRP